MVTDEAMTERRRRPVMSVVLIGTLITQFVTAAQPLLVGE